jgi:hypothetical protein
MHYRLGGSALSRICFIYLFSPKMAGITLHRRVGLLINNAYKGRARQRLWHHLRYYDSLYPYDIRFIMLNLSDYSHCPCPYLNPWLSKYEEAMLIITPLRSLRKYDIPYSCMCICMCKCIQILCAVVMLVQVCHENCFSASSCLSFRLSTCISALYCTKISYKLSILFKLDKIWTIYVKT